MIWGLHRDEALGLAPTVLDRRAGGGDGCCGQRMCWRCQHGLQLAAAYPQPVACSKTSPVRIPVETWGAARKELAPPGASAIRLCDYSGLNAKPRLTLASSRLLTSRILVRQLLSELDRIPRGPQGPHTCAADEGAQIVALLSYTSGPEVAIKVGLDGCRSVSNGSVDRAAFGWGAPRAFGPQLITHLDALLARSDR